MSCVGGHRCIAARGGRSDDDLGVGAGRTLPQPSGRAAHGVGVGERGGERRTELRLQRRQRHHAGFVDVGHRHRHAGRFRGRTVVSLHGHVVDIVRVRIGGVLVVRRIDEAQEAAGDRELRGIVAGQRPGDVVIDAVSRDSETALALGVASGRRAGEPRRDIRDCDCEGGGVALVPSLTSTVTA